MKTEGGRCFSSDHGWTCRGIQWGDVPPLDPSVLILNSRWVVGVICVLQWESQHAGLSCEQYQSWKRENDPEYQRQGLAGYLRDNGISEQRRSPPLSLYDQAVRG